MGFDNYIDVLKKDECFSALKLSLYYMAGAMVQLALALYLATILQKLFFKLAFRSSDADNEEYTRRKRLRRERRWKKEAV